MLQAPGAGGGAKAKSLRAAVEEGDVLGYEEERMVMGVLGVVTLVSGPYLLVGMCVMWFLRVCLLLSERFEKKNTHILGIDHDHSFIYTCTPHHPPRPTDDRRRAARGDAPAPGTDRLPHHHH